MDVELLHVLFSTVFLLEMFLKGKPVLVLIL